MSHLPNFVCVMCGRSVGSLEPDEVEAMAQDGFDFGAIVCFDCEPVKASFYPEFLRGLRPGDEFGCLFEDGPAHTVFQVTTSYTLARVCASGSMRARGLSSSTYLNTTLKNMVLGDKCPSCGGAHTQILEADIVCVECGESLIVPDELLLPAWLFQPAVESLGG